MRILGIDPGYGIVGFGLIEVQAGRVYKYITHGTIETSSELNLADRLLEISQDLQVILAKYQPDQVAIESLFFAKNSATAMKVAQAKGVILLEVARYGLEIVELTPLQVKSGLTGHGQASKSEVKIMVQKFLNLESLKGIDDAVDALAIALVAG